MELWRAGSTDYDRYTIVHLHSLRHLRHAVADARSAHGAVCIHFHFSSFPSRNGTDVSEMSAARTLANWYAKGKWYAALQPAATDGSVGMGSGEAFFGRCVSPWRFRFLGRNARNRFFFPFLLVLGRGCVFSHVER